MGRKRDSVCACVCVCVLPLADWAENCPKFNVPPCQLGRAL